MLWTDMQYLFATIYADEIEAVLRDGADAALRARLAEIPTAERELLRQALKDF